MQAEPPPPGWGSILLTAFIYAVAIVALVVLVPGGDHVFVYEGF